MNSDNSNSSTGSSKDNIKTSVYSWCIASRNKHLQPSFLFFTWFWFCITSIMYSSVCFSCIRDYSYCNFFTNAFIICTRFMFCVVLVATTKETRIAGLVFVSQCGMFEHHLLFFLLLCCLMFILWLLFCLACCIKIFFELADIKE